MLNGWVTVATILIAFAVMAFIAMRLGARSWWHYIAMLIFAVPFCPLVARTVMGDISRYTPPSAFDGDAVGKDQIIVASAGSTVLLALIISALLVGAVLWCWRVMAAGK
jgi:hypothetical protein